MDRDLTLAAKASGTTMTGANPDFCVRFPGERPLRVVGEVKYLPKSLTSNAAVEQVHIALEHYLFIESSTHPDWGHDVGFGIMYCAKGPKPRHAELLLDRCQTPNKPSLTFTPSRMVGHLLDTA
jgi:hypothetical protein